MSVKTIIPYHDGAQKPHTATLEPEGDVETLEAREPQAPFAWTRFSIACITGGAALLTFAAFRASPSAAT